MHENILITVCARGGSKGVKNKNIRKLCGIPLIAHTIRHAQHWGKADKIICSTDSNAIADVASKFGAEIPFLRPSELATDTAGKISVLRHALQTLEESSGKVFPIVVDLDVTSPLRKITDIEGAYKVFVNQRPDSVVSVTPARRNPYFNMLEQQKNGYVQVAKPLVIPILRRQDARIIYDMNASIYVYDRKYLLNPRNISSISSRTLPWVMDEWSAFDIDSEIDFQLVEFLVGKKMVDL